MEKIKTDYKRPIWEIKAKLFNMRKPWLSSFNYYLSSIIGNSDQDFQSLPNSYLYVFALPLVGKATFLKPFSSAPVVTMLARAECFLLPADIQFRLSANWPRLNWSDRVRYYMCNNIRTKIVPPLSHKPTISSFTWCGQNMVYAMIVRFLKKLTKHQ